MPSSTLPSSSRNLNLWWKALDSLDPTLQANLTSIVNRQKGDVVGFLLREAERKKDLCLQKQWKVNMRGKTIILRDVLDKIIAWVGQFRAVIDVVAQYDPSFNISQWTIWGCFSRSSRGRAREHSARFSRGRISAFDDNN